MFLETVYGMDEFPFLTVLSFIIIIFITGITGSYYTSTDPRKLPSDSDSVDRLTAISEAFTSLLGNNWPYVLLFISFMLIMVIVLFYFANKNESLTLSLSDERAHTLIIVFVVFLVVFTSVVIVLTVKVYREYVQSKTVGNIPNYEPSDEDKDKTKQIILGIGAGLIAVLLIMFGVWYFFYHSPKKPT